MYLLNGEGNDSLRLSIAPKFYFNLIVIKEIHKK